VADAVAVEPVSTLQFPANREKNREFNKIGASGAAEIVNNAVVTGLPELIPYSAEQGIILADQGIFAREQGFFPARIEVIAQ
jgi:hypothetical protein